MYQLTIFDIVPEFLPQPEPKKPERHKQENTEPITNGYSPGHPWYYKNGGRILAPQEITAVDFSQAKYEPVHRRNGKPYPCLEEQLIAAKRELTRDIERYNQLVKQGNAACSQYNLMMGYDAGSNLSLKHNHIAYHKGVVLHLEKMLPSFGF
jgi:hypothetical protein